MDQNHNTMDLVYLKRAAQDFVGRGGQIEEVRTRCGPALDVFWRDTRVGVVLVQDGSDFDEGRDALVNARGDPLGVDDLAWETQHGSPTNTIFVVPGRPRPSDGGSSHVVYTASDDSETFKDILRRFDYVTDHKDVEPPVATASGQERIGVDPVLISMLDNVVDGVLMDGKAYATGMHVDSSRLTHPDHFLPALLTVAADEWSPVVIANGGWGGFTVQLHRYEPALLGYRVVGIRTSSRFRLCAPVARIVRGMLDGDGNMHVDDVVQRFARWLRRNDFDTGPVDDAETRIIDAVLQVA